MSEKTYLLILKGGIYLSFLSIFLVFKSLLFPYISSKQIYFNVLIEILFVFWLALIVKYPAYRPKKSWISIGLAAFFAVLLISSFTGVDFNLSFWGDVERMLGVFHLLHFFVFYLIIITVFRERKDWLLLFNISVASAVVVAGHSLFGTAYATIGNTAYVSAFFIFNIYFAFLLFSKSAPLPLKIYYLAAAGLMIFDLWKLRTAGAYVGLGVSLLILGVLYAFSASSKKIKAAAALLVILFFVSAGLIFTGRESSFVKNNRFLSVFLNELSLQKGTFQTRLISWKAAAKDFPQHSFLGAGYGNFSISFDKYFDPVFYNYTAAETYFDRAHNNLVDITSTTGALGLAGYLSIFAAAFYYLARGYSRKEIARDDFALLVSLIVAYFIQNLAVFDALVTYISLMVMLGYVYWLSNRDEEALRRNVSADSDILTNKEIAAFFFAGLAMLFVIYQYNIKPLKMLAQTISGQYVFAQGDFAGAVEEYKKALSYNTPLDRDSRSTLIQLVTSNSNLLNQLESQKAAEILDYVIGLAETNVAYNPADSLMQMQLAQVLNIAASLYSGNGEKFYYYSNRALAAVDKSIQASPGRVPIYFVKAQIYLTRGEKNKAIETLRYAVSLNEKYPDSFCQLAKIYLFYKDEAEGYKALDSCIDLGAATALSPASFVKQAANHYSEAGDDARLIFLYVRLTVLEPDNAQVWAGLAQLYAKAGKKEEAKQAAQKVIELDPSMKEAAEKFIRELE